jgi:hypothetical protein
LYRATGYDSLQFKRILQDPCEALPNVSVSQETACALVQHFAWHCYWHNHLCDQLVHLKPPSDKWLSDSKDLRRTINGLTTLKINVSAYVLIDVVEGLGFLMLKELDALLQLLRPYYESLQQRPTRLSSNIQYYIVRGVNVSRRRIEETILLDLQRIIHFQEERTSLEDVDSGFFETDVPTSIVLERCSSLSEECSSLFSNLELAASGDLSVDRRTTLSVNSSGQPDSLKSHRTAPRRSWWLEPEGTRHAPCRRLYFDDRDEDDTGGSTPRAPGKPRLIYMTPGSTEEIGSAEPPPRVSSAQQLREAIYSWIENSPGLSRQSRDFTSPPYSITQPPSSLLTAA